MKAKDFETIEAAWSEKLSWDKAELKKIGSQLLALCKANAGEIAGDVQVTDEVTRPFRLSRAEDVLDRYVSKYAAGLRSTGNVPVYTAALQKPWKVPLACLVAHEWKERIDINTDDVEALSRINEIGSKTAQEILKHRKKHGRFSALDQLANIKGITPAAIMAISMQAFCREPEKTKVRSAEINAFAQRPTFRNYIRSIENTRGTLWSTGTKEDVKQHILSLLEKIVEDAKKNGHGAAKNLKYTRASKVIKHHAAKKRAAEICGCKTEKTECAALLYDAQYQVALAELLKNAKKSIVVMMFFMRYEKGTDYVVNPLTEQLVAGHKKGLKVKVILDRDAEDDVIGARLVNAEAFDFLKSAGVPVFYDTDGRMTHSKVVIVDGEHVVVGSHNWTAGSFLSYNDTSVYVASKELAAKYEKIVDGFWNAYNQPAIV